MTDHTYLSVHRQSPMRATVTTADEYVRFRVKSAGGEGFSVELDRAAVTTLHAQLGYWLTATADDTDGARGLGLVAGVPDRDLAAEVDELTSSVASVIETARMQREAARVMRRDLDAVVDTLEQYRVKVDRADRVSSAIAASILDTAGKL